MTEQDARERAREQAKTLAESIDSIDEATNRLMDSWRREPDFYMALSEPGMHALARSMVNQFRHRERTAMKMGPQRRSPEAAAAYQQHRIRSMLETWKIGDKPLGDATKREIRLARNADSAKAEGYWKNVAFYDALMERLGDDGEIVREKWGDDDAEQVWATLNGHPCLEKQTSPAELVPT